MSAVAFDPLRLLKSLDHHRVRFVVIGGIAGRLWGSPTVTNGLDICYARDGANLEALAAALRDLKVSFDASARTLELGDHFTFATRFGNLDILGTPKGTAGYDSLARTAAPTDVGGVNVLVAAIEELILMKRATGRPKDLVEVEILTAVKEEAER